jgi:hypothetical protein
MRHYYCLYFPTLATALARRPGGDREERPLVLIQGAGDAAVVTAASPLARARGAFTGMTAGQARIRCGSALFLPDNAGACLDELERLASILRRYATDSVAIGGRDHLLLHIESETAPAVMARRLTALVRSWCCHDVRAGVASSQGAALEAARAARRAPLVDGSPTKLPPAPYTALQEDGIAGASDVRGEGMVALRRDVFRLLCRLEELLAGRAQGFREVRIEVESSDATRVLRLRFENPAHTAGEVLHRLEQHLHSPELVPVRRVRITLERLCPDVRQRAAGEPGAPFALRAAG